MHTLPAHALTVIGGVLLVTGLTVYAVGIGTAVVRVRRQYSVAMPEMRSIRLGAALAAAGQLWPFFLLAAVGVALLLLGR